MFYKVKLALKAPRTVHYFKKYYVKDGFKVSNANVTTQLATEAALLFSGGAVQ